jgi:hypothetical protein
MAEGDGMRSFHIAGSVLNAAFLIIGGAVNAFRGLVAMAAMGRLSAHALGGHPYAGLGDGPPVGHDAEFLSLPAGSHEILRTARMATFG